jgi:DHA1 family inner membrane transport protein
VWWVETTATPKDANPHMTDQAVLTPGTDTSALLVISFVSGAPWETAGLVGLLGLFGLGANPVLIALAVRYAGRVPTLGSSLSVAAFNCGTALASWIAGISLASPLADTGPVVVGTVIAALTLIPAMALALTERRRTQDVSPALA